jgi:hypothetical protein
MTADCLEVVRSFVCTATGEQLGAACLHASTPNAALGPMRAQPWTDASPALAQCEPGLGRMQARHNAVVAPSRPGAMLATPALRQAWPCTAVAVVQMRLVRRPCSTALSTMPCFTSCSTGDCGCGQT